MDESIHVRRDINSQIKGALEEAGIRGEFKYVEEHGGRMMWFIEGEMMTTGEAADKYLPGGFKGNFGNGFGMPSTL